MIDDSTKILITTQQRPVVDPKGKNQAGADDAASEEKQAKNGPMRVSAILRSIPAIFSNMNKKTQADLNDPSQMKIVRK